MASERLFAGSYAEYWRGCLRAHGFPRYHCWHRHDDATDARQCALQALTALKETGKLPEKWTVYVHGS